MKIFRKITIWTRNLRGELTYTTDWKIMRDGVLIGIVLGVFVGFLVFKTIY